jgi:hypothetical protein
VAAAKQNSVKKTPPAKVDHETLLQTLLDDLQEGVIACSSEGTITLFNKAAATLFGGWESLKNSNSVYDLCCQSPVEHALNLLRYQKRAAGDGPAEPPAIQFLNTTADKKRFLRCRLSFLAPSDTKGFVIFFEDVSPWYRPDNLLFMKFDEFRGPMTNLRAAVENLTEHPEMSPIMRSAFENVLVQESLNLTEAFGALEKACNYLIQTQSHLIEIHSADLFNFIADQFSSAVVTFDIEPDRSAAVKVDSYGLLLVLEHLAKKILQKRKLPRLHCRVHTGKQFVYFDFLWTGELMPTAAVESLLQDKIDKSLGNMSVVAILHSMGGDMWSQQHDSSQSILRLALPHTLNPVK